jgi:hypothetical protein
MHMQRALLGLAAIAAVASISPASGQSAAAAGFSASSGTGHIESLRGRPAARNDFGRFGGGHHHHRHIRVGDGFGFSSGYNDYGDYDANRSFDPDKWNDWWHDRPDRAYPRWMTRNQDCARRWYSGDVLTC